jgi:hypothetical protein
MNRLFHALSKALWRRRGIAFRLLPCVLALAVFTAAEKRFPA